MVEAGVYMAGGFSVVLIIAILLAGGIHKIEEGYVGIYYRGGALLEQKTHPGFHVLIPFITSHHNVQITVQTDNVVNIPVLHILFIYLLKVWDFEWSVDSF